MVDLRSKSVRLCGKCSGVNYGGGGYTSHHLAIVLLVGQTCQQERVTDASSLAFTLLKAVCLPCWQ